MLFWLILTSRAVFSLVRGIYSNICLVSHIFFVFLVKPSNISMILDTIIFWIMTIFPSALSWTCIHAYIINHIFVFTCTRIMFHISVLTSHFKYYLLHILYFADISHFLFIPFLFPHWPFYLTFVRFWFKLTIHLHYGVDFLFKLFQLFWALCLFGCIFLSYLYFL